MSQDSLQDVTATPGPAVEASNWGGLLPMGPSRVAPALVTYRGETYQLVPPVPTAYCGILVQQVIDTLSIPVTSCEVELLFSTAGRLVTPRRAQLHDDTIE